MNNQQLKEIRRQLRRKTDQKYREVGKNQEDVPDGVLSLMTISQDAGEAHQARELLEMLPEPEAEAVLDYWALSRVERMELDTLYESPKPAIRDIKYEKHGEAQSIIEDRIEVDETPDEFVIVQDPVSKMQLAISPADHPHVSESDQIDNACRRLSQEILEMGAIR